MKPAPPVTSTRTAADATVADDGDEGALADQGPRSGRHRAPPRRVGAGARSGTACEPTAAYVLPWKDHLAGELEAAGVATVCLSTRRRDAALAAAAARGSSARRRVRHRPQPLAGPCRRRPAGASAAVPRARRPALVTTEHNTWTSLRPATRWANRLTGAARRGDVHRHRGDARRACAARPPGASRSSCTASTSIAPRLGRPASGPRPARSSGCDADELVIGTVANFRAAEGLPHPARGGPAARRSRRRVPARRRRPGPARRPRSPSSATSSDCASHVVLAGFRPDAVAVMAACDVFVLASAWEGLPVAAMEAAALGPADRGDRGRRRRRAVRPSRRRPRAAAGSGCPRRRARSRPRRSGAGDPSCPSRPAPRADRFDVRRVADTLTARYEQLAGSPADCPAQHRSCAPAAPAMHGTSVRRRRRRPGTDPRAARRVARLGGRRPRRPRAVRLEARAQPVRAVARLGRRTRRPDRRRPPVHALGVPSGRDDAVRAVRAVDTATHPDHQGRGLFTALTTARRRGLPRPTAWRSCSTPRTSRAGPATSSSAGARSAVSPPPCARRRRPGLVTIARSRVPADALVDPDRRRRRHRLVARRRRTPPRRRPARGLGDRSVAADRSRRPRPRWRYGLPALHYRVVDDDDASIIVRLRRRGDASELVVADQLGDPGHADRLAAGTHAELDATHALRLGAPTSATGSSPCPTPARSSRGEPSATTVHRRCPTGNSASATSSCSDDTAPRLDHRPSSRHRRAVVTSGRQPRCGKEHLPRLRHLWWNADLIAHGHGPVDHLFALATRQHLVLSNSTVSCWAAPVGDV